jgi:hypothetical protein
MGALFVSSARYWAKARRELGEGYCRPRTEVRGNWNVGCLGVRMTKVILNMGYLSPGQLKKD